MKVLHVIDSFDLGGAQVVVEQLVRHADRARFSPEVAALHGHGVMRARLAALDVPVRSLSPSKFLPLYLPRLLLLMAAQRYHVVHCHLLWANILAKPLAALCGCRARVNHDHCNDKSSLSTSTRWLDRRMNALSSHVITVSESTRGWLLRDLPPERVTTIHNGIDTDANQPRPERRAAARAEFGLGEKNFIVGGLGRLVFQKNFPLFLNVAALVQREVPEVEFIIAGTGPDDTALREQAVKLGVRVKFAGFIAEPARLWPALDCFLLTSRFEGLPMTILEAMACGVPIVASNLDGMREILRDGVTASLATPGDATDFARRIVEFARSPNHAHATAEAALQRVRMDFSAQRMTRDVEAIYAQCAPVS